MFRSYVLRYNLQLLSHRFRAYMPEATIDTRQEITKGLAAPVIVMSNDGVTRALIYGRFGFLVEGYFTAFSKPKNRQSYCFAKAEDVSNSRLYAEALAKNRRVLIPANEYWLADANQPISLHWHPIFAFAGLYNVTDIPGTSKELSFVVLTKAEGAGRAPIILTEKSWGPWLQGQLALNTPTLQP